MFQLPSDGAHKEISAHAEREMQFENWKTNRVKRLLIMREPPTAVSIEGASTPSCGQISLQAGRGPEEASSKKTPASFTYGMSRPKRGKSEAKAQVDQDEIKCAFGLQRGSFA